MSAIPNPKVTAQAEAARINANPAAIEWGLGRVLDDAPFIDREALLIGLEAFHVERMAKIPSATTYPEAQPWVDYMLAVDKELQALTGITTLQMAMFRSLGPYVTFRGYAVAKPAMAGEVPRGLPAGDRPGRVPHQERGRSSGRMETACRWMVFRRDAGRDVGRRGQRLAPGRRAVGDLPAAVLRDVRHALPRHPRRGGVPDALQSVLGRPEHRAARQAEAQRRHRKDQLQFHRSLSGPIPAAAATAAAWPAATRSRRKANIRRNGGGIICKSSASRWTART